ncbi:AAA family ATPase [Bacillus sp. ISL-35]|uniref:AAA family ATPase n=1 Tax=Bacillus sp. ISL-35 TaxID=2819122 RepID=UPI001BEB7561|nr:AAA family ATPase [Bacillus sp. ISL-35]MBT2679371.1 AAA family ATPase [Bacillus sp. ISL-35]
MKRLVVITVGKTHSGKTTFARDLEKELYHSIVMDQDSHAEFINTYYKKLQPKDGPNTLKHAISKLIVQYTIEHTNHHLIICNSNRSRKGRSYLLEELFPPRSFTRILVHFDIPDNILEERIALSRRSKDIFRGNYSSFMDVLDNQREDSLKEDVIDPTKDEADFLYVIKDSKDTQTVIQKILHIAKSAGEYL